MPVVAQVITRPRNTTIFERRRIETSKKRIGAAARALNPQKHSFCSLNLECATLLRSTLSERNAISFLAWFVGFFRY
jgi:hypothetical protein